MNSSIWQRYEVKFLVDEATAARVERFCYQNLSLDEYCKPFADHQYPIHSIYLDSPHYAIARSVIDRKTDRFKLRVRTYCDHYESTTGRPFFFEIKRKLNGIIHKKRARLVGNFVEDALWKSIFPVLSSDDGRVDRDKALNEFFYLRQQTCASPVLSVHYRRLAFESNFGQRVRISFDRDLRYGLIDQARGTVREGWWPVRLQGVILEVKFTNTYPQWVEHVIRGSDLVRRGVCKYLLCAQSAFGLFQPIEERRAI